MPSFSVLEKTFRFIREIEFCEKIDKMKMKKGANTSENSVADSRAKSLVYDYLMRHNHLQIATEFFMNFGPFPDFEEIKLEEVCEQYLNGRKIDQSNYVSCAYVYERLKISNENRAAEEFAKMFGLRRSIEKTKVKDFLESHFNLAKTSSRINSLVYDFLIRNSHFETANEFAKEFGPFQKHEETKLEDIYECFTEKVKPKVSRKKVVKRLTKNSSSTRKVEKSKPKENVVRREKKDSNNNASTKSYDKEELLRISLVLEHDSAV